MDLPQLSENVTTFLVQRYSHFFEKTVFVLYLRTKGYFYMLHVSAQGRNATAVPDIVQKLCPEMQGLSKLF